MATVLFELEQSPPLSGEAALPGAKNAILPLLAAALLTKEEVFIDGLPLIADVENMLSLLQSMGVKVRREGERACVLCAEAISPPPDTYALIKTMRASVLVLGPLLARNGEARLALPGGCPIGARPIDLHLKGFRRMGAAFKLDGGSLTATARHLHGATIYLDLPSVGATENLMMAAALADGVTEIHNAAKEPEIADLAKALNAMGACVQGAGEGSIVIRGVEALTGAKLLPMPDRIFAGTLMLIAATTGGDVLLRDASAEHLTAVIDKLSESGAAISAEEGGLRVKGRAHKAVDVKTLVYPGFPTDLQAPMTALLCRAKGTSVMVESIFENRFLHAAELRRMGAQITVRDRVAIIRGVPALYGAAVTAEDLRGGAALVLAGLAAEGRTQVYGVEHIDRGYERLENTLRALGGRIRRL